MVANLSIVERERDFTGVEGTGAIVQHGRPPRIYIRVCRRATQSSLPDSLLERRTAEGGGGNGGIQFKCSRFGVIAPVGIYDRLAAVAKFFFNQSFKFFHSHRIGIGTVEPSYTLVKICAGQQWNVRRYLWRSWIEWMTRQYEAVYCRPPIVFAVLSAKGRFGPRHFLHGFRRSARKPVNRD